MIEHVGDKIGLSFYVEIIKDGKQKRFYLHGSCRASISVLTYIPGIYQTHHFYFSHVKKDSQICWKFVSRKVT